MLHMIDVSDKHTRVYKKLADKRNKKHYGWEYDYTYIYSFYFFYILILISILSIAIYSAKKSIN